MGFWSSVKSFVSSAVSTVASAVSKGFDAAREIAGKAIGWLADEAETFVGSVKETWKKVRPVLAAIKPFFGKAADIAFSANLPWLGRAIVLLDKALTELLKLENSPILKRLDSAIQWAIRWAREFKARMTAEEAAEARRHRKTFEEAATTLPQQVKREIDLASLINNYALASEGVESLLEAGEIADFDHYLRLRATQKLLRMAEETLRAATAVEDISDDDIFLVKIASALIAPAPIMTDAEGEHLDRIIQKRHQKNLLPFVFEELTKAWDIALQADEKRWEFDNRRVAKDRVLLRQLETQQRLGALAPEEVSMLSELQGTMPEQTAALAALEKLNRERRNYVFASEGFLQMLEKTEAQLASEGKSYVISQGREIGMILIDCAQHGKPWDALTADQQSLIIDFANIFESESHARGNLLEVEGRA